MSDSYDEENPIHTFRAGELTQKFLDSVERDFNGSKTALVKEALKSYFEKKPPISTKNMRKLKGLCEFTGKNMDGVVELLIKNFMDR